MRAARLGWNLLEPLPWPWPPGRVWIGRQGPRVSPRTRHPHRRIGWKQSLGIRRRFDFQTHTAVPLHGLCHSPPLPPTGHPVTPKVTWRPEALSLAFQLVGGEPHNTDASPTVAHSASRAPQYQPCHTMPPQCSHSVTACPSQKRPTTSHWSLEVTVFPGVSIPPGSLCCTGRVHPHYWWGHVGSLP